MTVNSKKVFGSVPSTCIQSICMNLQSRYLSFLLVVFSEILCGTLQSSQLRHILHPTLCSDYHSVQLQS
uniref:Uncharacterized protein n=1 Tax=Anguilla anguilla TaxID=7936 RepID=A0A0E9PAY9_ANGAN